MTEIRIRPRSPYNFTLSLDFLIREEEDQFPCIREDDNLLVGIAIGNKIWPLKIRPTGTIAEPRVIIRTSDDASREDLILMKKAISNYLSLHQDLIAAYQVMERDSFLAKLTEHLFGFKAPKIAFTIFEGIVKAIIQQQISLLAAYRITSKLIWKYGTYVTFEGDSYYTFPTPFTLAKAPLLELKSCGLSSQKSEYIKDFSERVAKGKFNPERLITSPPSQVVEELTKLRGIGEWTAELVLAACTDRNVVPAADLGVRQAISRYYFANELQEPDTIRRFLSRWGRQKKTIVTYLLYARRLGLDS